MWLVVREQRETSGMKFNNCLGARKIRENKWSEVQ